MKTKIVYVLVSSEKDIYLEQAYVSMYSLKHYNPDAHIVLLTDKRTSLTFEGVREKEVSLADEIVTVELSDALNAQQRSRQLKTSVRQHVTGDFLFIDCDTLVVKSLEAIDRIKDVKIAACRDTHALFAENPYRKMCLEHGKMLDWPIESETDYFNSGVVYVKDCPESHEFYRKWNENLNKGYPKKVYMDQPSFAKTNFEMGHIVKMLPDVWNCELKHGIRYLKDAFIVHYLCTNSSQFQNKQLFLLNEEDVLLRVKRTGDIPIEVIETINDPFKGLAEITHCFAGEDVYFLQTGSYLRLRRQFHGEIPFFLKAFLKIYDYGYSVLKVGVGRSGGG